MDSSLTSQTAESYNRLANIYESRWEDYLSHTHMQFLKKVKFNSGDTILDLSCGTGLLAQNVIDGNLPFQQLTLNDIAKDMQAIAKDRFADHTDINFTSFPADAIDFSDRSFDKIFCLNAFHNYHKQEKVLAECRRTLKPGGKIYILDWNKSGFFRIKNWVIKKIGREYIDTKSAREITAMLNKQQFKLSHVNEWYHHTWKFFYVIGEKK